LGQPPAVPPVMLYEIEVFDSFPAGYGTPLPGFAPLIDEAGLGLDVDPETGDIWLATRQQGQAAHLLRHLDQFGNVLETQTLPFPNGSPPVRGLGFDHGNLFVVTGMRNIYEIDRSNGSILGSFTLPVTGFIGGLTGGDVVPEPATIGLVGICFVGLAVRRRT
jgi:hypothetical protein